MADSTSTTIAYFESIGLSYIDDNPCFVKHLRNIIYYNYGNKEESSLVSKAPFPFVQPFAILDSSIDISSELFGRKNKNIEIVTYESIKKRGWQIIKRPVINRTPIGTKTRYIYYLRNTSDRTQIVGTILIEQPQSILIQIDNIKKLLRLIGKEVSIDGKRATSWRKIIPNS